MLRDAHDLMTCLHCHQPVILTVDSGLCPRCFYRHECEAICAAAEEEVDRVLTEEVFSEVALPALAAEPRAPVEPVWSW